MAAAGIDALTNHVDRLEQDHDNALALAKGLSDVNGITIDLSMVQTNIVFADIQTDMTTLADFLKQKGILISASNPVRLVTHMGISHEDIDQTIEAFKAYF